MLTASLQTAPGGLLALSANGGLVYTPTLNFNGAVTFTYIVQYHFLELPSINRLPRAISRNEGAL